MVSKNPFPRPAHSDIKKIYDTFGDGSWTWADVKNLGLEKDIRYYTFRNEIKSVGTHHSNKTGFVKIYKINERFLTKKAVKQKSSYTMMPVGNNIYRCCKCGQLEQIYPVKQRDGTIKMPKNYRKCKGGCKIGGDT